MKQKVRIAAGQGFWGDLPEAPVRHANSITPASIDATFALSSSERQIILGANDFDGDTAERYGYVNRSLPDAELDGFVDALARRIASFDRRALAAAKNLVNQVSLPPADRLLDAFTSFGAALTWPEAQHRIQAVVDRGLQRDANFEKSWPEVLGNLVATEKQGQSDDKQN